MRSKLLNISIKNLGCIGENGLTIDLDNIICLVGQNNSGKSTVLRAYELAVGTQTYNYEKDHCKKSDGNTEIEISVHIPENTGNIAEKWKEKNGALLVVKSRWIWDSSGIKTRKTYDPEISEYSEDGNAAGLDNVFNSRLPRPFRIGALENTQAELKNLLKLVLDPITESLKKKLEDKDSALCKALDAFNIEAKLPVTEHKENIETYNKEITKSHNQIFPNLSVDLNIGMSEIKIDTTDALIKGSKLTIKEFEDTIDWDQQGTGSQRALFWSLLQVRSKLQSIKDSEVEKTRKRNLLEKEIKKLETARDKASKQETKDAKQAEIDSHKADIANIIDNDEVGNNDITLPGYMLLIDEPEVALHPNGIRAASQYLYDLAKDPSWQVMLTTHSPLFVNPFEDHTTIVRLSRDETSPTPKTYRSDLIKFEETEIDQLKLLNTFDQNLAEMFFGQYPVVVEGDTEFAAFHRIMQMNPAKYPLGSKPLIIRARGKFTITAILKMLTHFKINFSVLHDIDFPKTKNGGVNGVWTFNDTLYKDILKSRAAEIKIIHRVSTSTFEVEHFGVTLDPNGNISLPLSKEKPWIMYDKVKNDNLVKTSVERVFDDLINTEALEEPYENPFNECFKVKFNEWVKTNGILDPRFQQ